MRMHDLLGFTKPRKPRRVLMHFYDAGQAPAMMPGWTTTGGAAFRCNRCGHDDGWTFNLTDSKVRSGLPCPKCNADVVQDDSGRLKWGQSA